MSKKLDEKIHNLASSALSAGSILELIISKIEDIPCECMDDDVFSSLMAVKEYLHDSVGVPLVELAESKEVKILVQEISNDNK